MMPTEKLKEWANMKTTTKPAMAGISGFSMVKKIIYKEGKIIKEIPVKK